MVKLKMGNKKRKRKANNNSSRGSRSSVKGKGVSSSDHPVVSGKGELSWDHPVVSGKGSLPVYSYRTEYFPSEDGTLVPMRIYYIKEKDHDPLQYLEAVHRKGDLDFYLNALSEMDYPIPISPNDDDPIPMCLETIKEKDDDPIPMSLETIQEKDDDPIHYMDTLDEKDHSIPMSISTYSKEEEGKSVYVWFAPHAVSGEDTLCPLFIIKPYQLKGFIRKSQPPIQIHSFKKRDSFGCVACQSKIYVFGGSNTDYGKRDPNGYSYYKGSTDLLVYDTKNPNAGWIKHKMPQFRFDTIAIAIDKKIYLFGSTERTNPPNPWAQVFDTEANTWNPLIDPPTEVLRVGSVDNFAVINGGQDILFFLDRKFFLYNVKLNTPWVDVTEKYELPFRYSKHIAVVGDILYMYDYGFVVAYHLKDLKYLGPVRGLERGLGRTGYPMGSVFDLGNDMMCVIWSVFRKRTKCFLKCLTFGVAQGKDENGETAIYGNIISYACYDVHYGHDIIWSVAL